MNRLRHAAVLMSGFAISLAAGWTGLPAALYSRSAQPVQFNHKIHKDKGSMSCADCHSVREDGSFAGIPATDSCGGCHAEPMGETANEKVIVAEYVKPNRPIGWHVYSRQPMNVRFSHSVHVNLGKLTCETCHGAHGTTERLREYQENRISGYSRDIWGLRMLRVGLKPGEGMKMSDCESCHHERGVQAGCLGCHR